jgi:hypothetical protein
METQDTRWYETNFMRSLQEKCDLVSTELCHEALVEEMQRPFEIEFFDGRGSFCELTVREYEIEWNWEYHIRHDQQVEEPLTAVLKSRDRQSLRQTFTLQRQPELKANAD